MATDPAVLSLGVLCTCLADNDVRLYIRHLPCFVFVESSFVSCLFPNVSQICGRQIIFTAVLNIISFPSSAGSI